MSFGAPLVLLGLLVLPLLAWWYVGQQRQRARAASAFVAPKLLAGTEDPNAAPRLEKPRLSRVGSDFLFSGRLSF